MGHKFLTYYKRSYSLYHLKAASAHPSSEKMLGNTGHEQSIPGKTSNEIYVKKAKHDCNSWLKMQIVWEKNRR